MYTTYNAWFTNRTMYLGIPIGIPQLLIAAFDIYTILSAILPASCIPADLAFYYNIYLSLL